MRTWICLLALVASLIACGGEVEPAEDALVITHERLGPDRWRLHFRAGTDFQATLPAVSPATGGPIFELVDYSQRLALSLDRPWTSMAQDRGPGEAPGSGWMDIEMWHEIPEGFVVLGNDFDRSVAGYVMDARKQLEAFEAKLAESEELVVHRPPLREHH